MMPETLSLAELEAYDPAPWRGSRERRFLCPRCGDGHRRDAAHRSLSLNTETGAWRCHRCEAAGLLAEFQTRADSQPYSPHSARRSALQRRAALPPTAAAPEAKTGEGTLTVGGRTVRTLALSAPAARAGRDYLARRAIPPTLAEESGASYSPALAGLPSVIFPLHDAHGRLVAAQGRRIAPEASPKALSAGPVGQGAFATAGAWGAEILAVTEAPLDALSLAACGLPALALCGKDVRHWLAPRLAFRPVLIALDADPAGDAASNAWASALAPFTRRAARLRPQGGKDWNELLMGRGRDFLAAWLADRLGEFQEAHPDPLAWTDSEPPGIPPSEEAPAPPQPVTLDLGAYEALFKAARAGTLPLGAFALEPGVTVADLNGFVRACESDFQMALAHPDSPIWQALLPDRLASLDQIFKFLSF